MNSLSLAILFILTLIPSRNGATNPQQQQQQQRKDKIHTFPLLSHSTVTSRSRRRNRHLQPRRRRRLHQEITSLYEGYGTHYVDLWVGTPTPQRQTVIVDTGSQLTAFPCYGCTNCGDHYHTDNYFDYRQSQTFRKLSCDDDGCFSGHCTDWNHGRSGGKDLYCKVGLSYQEGSSWDAFEAVDELYAGGVHDRPVVVMEEEGDGGNNDGEVAARNQTSDVAPVHAAEYSFELTFGCQTSLTGLFKTQLADGIMGMSMERGAFWKQMHKSGQIEREMFSLCFQRQVLVEKAGTLAGAMSLGGFNENLWKTPLVYAKLMKGAGFYQVRGRAVYIQPSDAVDVGDIVKLDVDEAALNNGGVIVDSGTTDTYLTADLEYAFMKVWKDITGQNYNNGEIHLTQSQLERLPTILYQLEGVDNKDWDPDQTPGLAGKLNPKRPHDVIIKIPPQHYMEMVKKGNIFASRLFVNERGGSVLGANTMMGHDIVFDMDNSRIGVAESDCDYVTVTNTDIHDMGVSTKRSNPFDFDTERYTCSTVKCWGFVTVGLLFVLVQIVWAWKMLRPERLAVPVQDVEDEEEEGEFQEENDDYQSTELVSSTNPVV